MPQVLLIGDSIRMSYTKTVQDELAGVATVDSPAVNGSTSRRVLELLDGWLVDAKPQIAHVNAGLHDLAIDPEAKGRPRVELEEYEQNVRKIVQRLRAAGAKVIWALTTPVNGQWHHARKGFDRWEKDVDAYNAVARRVCTELNVPITDLFKLVQDRGPDSMLLEDGVHFKPEACRELGKAVAAHIRRHLEA